MDKKFPITESFSFNLAGIGRHTDELCQDEQEEIVVDTTVDPSIPTFPVYTAEEIKKERKFQLSSSTMEVHRTGVSSQSTPQNRKRGEIRIQNQRHASNLNVSSKHSDIDPGHSKRTPPKRSHSFSSNGSPKFEVRSPLTDYPVAHAQREAVPRQYPLREAASMQEITSGREASTSAKIGSHGNRPINSSSLKSSSVRNIPSSASNHGNRYNEQINLGIMHQQVYSGGLSYTSQTLSPSARHTEPYGGLHDSQRNRQAHTQSRNPRPRATQTRVSAINMLMTVIRFLFRLGN